MANVVDHRKCVMTDAINNNNKFWEFHQYDDGTVKFRWGRVGKTAQETVKNQTLDETLKLLKEKLKKGYTEIKVITDQVSSIATSLKAESKAAVHEAATKQLIKRADPVLVALVKYLVEQNKHELHKASGGKLDVDLNTGIISTPIGVVTKDNVTEARKLLTHMATYVQSNDFDNKKFIEMLNRYLMLVPQVVGHSRGWHHYFMRDLSAVTQQNTLLDQLESSADLAAARVATGAKTSVADTPSLFDAEIEVVQDLSDKKRIEKLFYDSINRSHTSAGLKPVEFYHVKLNKREEAFAKDGAKVGNIMQLWHGTRVFNVLSILKHGLIVPKSGGSINITGRMFGDGVYGSDQSTKALNYAQGYWDRGARDNNCFMFLADFAMGKYYVPDRTIHRIPAGYDSCFAKAGRSGVMNNEMIVYRESQVTPKYLIKFTDKR